MNFLISGLLLTMPIFLAAIGDIYAEKSGVLNLGIEATMIMGAYFSYHFAYFYGDAYVGLVAAVIVGLLMGSLNGLFLVSLKCSQVIYGVAINIFALAFTSTFYQLYFAGSAELRSPGLPRMRYLWVQELPFIGPILANQTLLFYFGLFSLFLTIVLFKYSPVGLIIKAVGENPFAADSLGINVSKTRFLSLVVSGLFSGLGGAALTIGSLQYFQHGMTAGRGFVALAAIIFGRYTPIGLMAGSLLFGMTNAFQLRMQIIDLKIPYQLFLAMPYLVTIMAMYIVGPSAPPRYLTVPFVREERK